MVKVAEFVSVGRQVLGHSSTTPPPVTEPPEAPGLAALLVFRDELQVEADQQIDEDGCRLILPDEQAFKNAELFLRDFQTQNPLFTWVGNPSFDLIFERSDSRQVTVRFSNDGSVLVSWQTEDTKCEVAELDVMRRDGRAVSVFSQE
ncbi:MAG: hypothetical protein SF002_10665 [Alphaproteobacteria bacterium]|nr:hypothetical protein [Alphaproteobacteria bacterium]